ncbi:MAG: prepilin-type N-terminal cleavage/methylation domain-containing protein [Candidatus Aminicenantes bacterium]|nr:prepilin-type N-terminal cleavage/methylation domain-containing protein [Candidatus Aminicenantes bacterium]
MKKQGFTVIELLVVIAIFGAVVAMVASIGPSVGKRAKLNRTVNSFVADINLAKNLASAENKFVAIDFSDDGASYRILKQKDIMYLDPTFDTSYGWTYIKTVNPLEGESFFNPDNVVDIAFNSTGQPHDVNTQQAQQFIFTIFVKKSRSGPPEADNIDYIKKVTIYPYGGVKIE